jgi:hypothetical protein
VKPGDRVRLQDGTLTGTILLMGDLFSGVRWDGGSREVLETEFLRKIIL